MFHYFEKVRIYRTILLSYVLILVIPLISSFIIYQISIHKIKENATENSKNLLNQTKDTIDRKNEELENFVYQLSINQDINQLIYRKGKTTSNYVYDIYKIKNSMKPYGYTNTLFQDFYIYFNEIDTIVSPKSSYVRPKDFYNNHVYQDISYEDWMENINKGYHARQYLPSTKVQIMKSTKSIITYIQSIPLDTKKKSQANIVVMMNEEEIGGLLNRISSQYDGASFIHDVDGNIIVSDNMDASMVSFNQSTKKYSIKDNKKKYIMIESKSDNNKWTYVAIISKDKLAEDVMYIQTVNFTIALITIIVGLCIAIYFSYKHSIPLNRLLGIMSIPETRTVKDPYDFIHSNVEDIIANNDHLKGQIQDQLPILQDSIIRKLVTGEISSSRDAMALIEQANIPLKGAFGYVGIAQIIHIFHTVDKDMLNEMNVAQLVIQNELNDIFQGAVLYCNLGIDQVVFLMSYYKKPSFQEERKLEESLHLLLNRLEDKYSLKVNIGTGKKFEQFIDIHQSYEEAKLSLPLIQSMDDTASVYTYTDQSYDEKMDFYYPIEFELRLMNAVMNGNTDEVRELLDKVYVENVKERMLTQQIGCQILASLNGTIMRLLSKNTQLKKITVDEILEHIEKIKSKKIEFEKDMRLISGMMMEITQLIHEKKIVGSQRIIYKIKEVVKNTASDPNLSLYKISEMVDFPEKMLPVIFKEHTGVNISDFIEDVRLNFAKSKLIQTDDAIVDIALHSGYNSAHSFRRAFKRNTGVSPSEYRKMMNKESE